MNIELRITDTQIGTGKEATKGALIFVHYEGFLDDGTKFDSSRDRGQPFSFVLGAGRVIQGWEKGFAGMKEGGTRTLIIPPDLGYGNRAIGPIPPNSVLTFHVELIECRPRE